MTSVRKTTHKLLKIERAKEIPVKHITLHRFASHAWVSPRSPRACRSMSGDDRPEVGAAGGRCPNSGCCQGLAEQTPRGSSLLWLPKKGSKNPPPPFKYKRVFLLERLFLLVAYSYYDTPPGVLPPYGGIGQVGFDEVIAGGFDIISSHRCDACFLIPFTLPRIGSSEFFVFRS